MHPVTSDYKHPTHVPQASFALQRANQPSLVCIKLSILLFYLRLFPGRKFAIAAYINMALHHLLGYCHLDRESQCLLPHCLFLRQDHSRRLLQKPSHQRDHQWLPFSPWRHLHPPPADSYGLETSDQLTPQTSLARHLPPWHPVGRLFFIP